MKKLVTTITILISTVSAFASEGAADRLVSGVFSLIISFVCVLIVSLVLTLIGFGCKSVYEFMVELCKRFWNNSTTIGKLIVFGIPLSVVSGFVFYGIIYYVAPCVVSNIIPFLVDMFMSLMDWIMDDFVGKLIVGFIIERVCIGIGWGDFEKRDGRVATVARAIVLLPFLPVIYPGYYLVQLFKAFCIKDSVANFNPHIVRR